MILAMSGGEIYSWAVMAVMAVAILAGCISAFRYSLLPPGGAPFISEEEFRRIESCVSRGSSHDGTGPGETT